MKLIIKNCGFGLFFCFLSSICTADGVVVTGYREQATPGNTGAGVSFGDPTPGVGSYDMSQGSRGVAAQKASCQSALNGFDSTYEVCIRDANQLRVLYIAASQNSNLPDNQAMFNADVLRFDGQLNTDKGTCTTNYNSKIRALNSGGCSGLVPATVKPMP